jgi:hypothetical protein
MVLIEYGVSAVQYSDAVLVYQIDLELTAV